MRFALARGVCLVWLGVAVPVGAAAQETRADLIAAAQADKAQRLIRYEPSKAERIVLGVKRRLFETPDGFYPWFDSVYSGGGLTVGGGYRRFYGDQTFWSARGLFSVKGYKLGELSTESLGLARGRVDFRAAAGWRDATQVAYYGIGGDTAQEAQTNFQMKQAYGGVTARARGPGALIAEFGLRYEDFTIASGHGTTPSVEDVHTADTAPGLGQDLTYVRSTLTGGVDWRAPSGGYARRGGLYALTYDAYTDVDGTYSFDSLQAELVQHVPILRENWVLSFHAVAKTTLDDEAVVPFYLLPSLGSGSTLRAYPSWRFRDRHSLLATGEFRWIPSQLFLDMAIFYDAGKVVGRRDDLNFEGLKHNWGVGVRFHGPLTTPLRIELARGSEGFNLVFAGAAAF